MGSQVSSEVFAFISCICARITVIGALFCRYMTFLVLGERARIIEYFVGLFTAWMIASTAAASLVRCPEFITCRHRRGVWALHCQVIDRYWEHHLVCNVYVLRIKD